MSNGQICTPDSYAAIFQQRGQAHDDAFTRYPDACREEIATVLRLAAPRPGETLLDLPAAGGFLSRYLSTPDLNVLAVDPSPVMHELCKRRVKQSYLAPLSMLPLADASVDVVVCLAGLHHEPDVQSVFVEIRRVLRSGGRLAIAEVSDGSPEAQFLNGFVHEHNSVGHRGRFLDDEMLDTLRRSGFLIMVNEQAHYHWPFVDRAALADCLGLMFGIDRASPQAIIDAVGHGLGVDELPGGGIGMRWSLRTVLALPTVDPVTRRHG